MSNTEETPVIIFGKGTKVQRQKNSRTCHLQAGKIYFVEKEYEYESWAAGEGGGSYPVIIIEVAEKQGGKTINCLIEEIERAPNQVTEIIL